uniref:Uncharacterized protein n=1 Tax=Vitis vinifera TaxID=29760 RepID=A5C5J1_VITVI|nr:hypothetical protein VITISV_030845 [Vitis vinifera]
MDVSLESKSLPSVGYSRKSYLQTTSQRLARGKLVHLNRWRSLALPSVGPGEHRGTVQKNISKCRSQISGSFRRTPRHCAKWLRNSPGKRYQRIRICLTGEVETPSSPIRRQEPDVKYPDGMAAEKKYSDGMSAEQNSGCETSGWNVGGVEFRM